MAVVPTIQDEKGYGPNGNNVAGLISRLQTADWFSSAGQPKWQVEAEKVIRTFTGLFPFVTDQIGWVTKDQLFVKTVIGSILYVCGLACAWELITDIDGWTMNPFLPLIDVIEQGHWMIGYFDHQFPVL
ncbi:hypothetical protein [Brevibacillus choshinensis]|uniref:hypothetical protein n=1 Tax=Brevibacillus choshinensis TaxID=54911 RepID=UPI002E1B1C30|nr:hypothetical protein [Brevibacillus choshinensis]